MSSHSSSYKPSSTGASRRSSRTPSRSPSRSRASSTKRSSSRMSSVSRPSRSASKVRTAPGNTRNWSKITTKGGDTTQWTPVSRSTARSSVIHPAYASTTGTRMSRASFIKIEPAHEEEKKESCSPWCFLFIALAILAAFVLAYLAYNHFSSNSSEKLNLELKPGKTLDDKNCVKCGELKENCVCNKEPKPCLVCGKKGCPGNCKEPAPKKCSTCNKAPCACEPITICKTCTKQVSPGPNKCICHQNPSPVFPSIVVSKRRYAEWQCLVDGRWQAYPDAVSYMVEQVYQRRTSLNYFTYNLGRGDHMFHIDPHTKTQYSLTREFDGSHTPTKYFGGSYARSGYMRQIRRVRPLAHHNRSLALVYKYAETSGVRWSVDENKDGKFDLPYDKATSDYIEICYRLGEDCYVDVNNDHLFKIEPRQRKQLTLKKRGGQQSGKGHALNADGTYQLDGFERPIQRKRTGRVVVQTTGLI